MENRYTLSAFRAALLIALIDAVGMRSQGQLVFVPDTMLRTAINLNTPGAVNGAGYIDMSDPVVMATTHLDLGLDLSLSFFPVDLTGIEGFGQLDSLSITIIGVSASAIFTAWPPTVSWMRIDHSGYTDSLPPLPTTLLHLEIDGMAGLTDLPSLPPALESLKLIYMADLMHIPSFPSSLISIQLEQLAAFSDLPSLPAGLEYLSLLLVDIDTIPNWPVSPAVMHIGYVPLAVAPPLPQRIDSLLTMGFLDLPFLPALPDTCPRLGLNNLSIMSLPDLPDIIDFLSLYDLPNVNCLPWLPNTINELLIQGMPNVECLPNLPAQLDTTFLMNGYYVWTSPALLCSTSSSTCPPMAAAISGTAFYDVNADGVRDAGESGYLNASVTVSPGGLLMGTNPNGDFSAGVLPGSYTLVCSANSNYSVSISPAWQTAVPASVLEIDSLNDFGIVLQPGIQDLTVGATADFARPGFDNNLWLNFHNAGSIPMDGSVSFTFDANQSNVSSSIVPDAQTGNTLTWNFTALAVGETRSIQLVLHTDVGVPIGTGLSHSLVVDPIATDQTPLDNSFILTTTVVGSFDPNDKAVSPEMATPWQVSAGLDLDYTIRFQNTGTAAASRVIITDTLSSDLQWGTFSFVGSSHPCSWYVQNGVAVFTFDPIYLPDSTTDEAGSHGFVRFHIQPVTSLGNGATVSNEANIYFDFNAPVITEPCLFAVDASVGMQEEANADMLLFPNPATSELWISLPGQVTGPIDLRILDVTGRVVMQQRTQGSWINVGITGIVPGAYRLELNDGAKIWAKGFVKR